MDKMYVSEFLSAWQSRRYVEAVRYFQAAKAVHLGAWGALEDFQKQAKELEP